MINFMTTLPKILKNSSYYQTATRGYSPQMINFIDLPSD